VAGKPFRGVGDGEDSSLSRDAAPLIADEDDAQGLHSGPTVVDDKKVEEVLRKLRSLDKPPGPLTGVTQAVTDGASTERVHIDAGQIQLDSGPSVDLDSGPTRIADVLAEHQQRATAIGHSLATPVAGVTVPADLARGTLFGRSIHLPDVNSPDDMEVEISSGPHLVDGTPPPLAPFPLAERPAIPPLAPPLAPPVERFHIPFEVDSQTQLVDPPRSRGFQKFLAFVGGVAVLGGGVWAWSKYSGKIIGNHNPPSAAAPAPAAPAEPAPVVAPSEPTPAAAGPSAAPAAEAPAPAPKAEPEAAAPEAKKPTAADEPAPAPRAAAAKEPRSHSRRGGSSSARHAASRTPAPAPADEDGAEKPSRPHKKALPDDPDATMAPTE